VIYYNVMVNISMCYSNQTIVNMYWYYRKLVHKIIVNGGCYRITYFVVGYWIYSPCIYIYIYCCGRKHINLFSLIDHDNMSCYFIFICCSISNPVSGWAFGSRFGFSSVLSIIDEIRFLEHGNRLVQKKFRNRAFQFSLISIWFRF